MGRSRRDKKKGEIPGLSSAPGPLQAGVQVALRHWSSPDPSPDRWGVQLHGYQGPAEGRVGCSQAPGKGSINAPAFISMEGLKQHPRSSP